MRATRPTIVELRGSQLGLDIRAGSARGRGRGPPGRGRGRRAMPLSRPGTGQTPPVTNTRSVKAGPNRRLRSVPSASGTGQQTLGARLMASSRPAAPRLQLDAASSSQLSLPYCAVSAAGSHCSQLGSHYRHCAACSDDSHRRSYYSTSATTGDSQLGSCAGRTVCSTSDTITPADSGRATGAATSGSSCCPAMRAGRKGVTFSDTLSGDTNGGGRVTPSSDELIGELLSRGAALRQRMQRLLASRSESLSPPPSEPESGLTEQERPLSSVGCPTETDASQPRRLDQKLSDGGRPRCSLTLPSHWASSVDTGTVSSVPLAGTGTASGRTTLVTRRCRRPQDTGARLSVLQRVSFLRLWLDSVSLDPVFVKSVLSAPDATDTRLYVEYQLPSNRPGATAKTTRLGGRKLHTEVTLQHRSVVPIQLTEATVRLWRAAELQLTLLGWAAGRSWPLAVAALPLRQLLRAPQLALSRRLPLTLRAAGRPLVGQLRLRLQLGSDKQDFQAALSAPAAGFRLPRRRSQQSRQLNNPRRRPLSTDRGAGDADSAVDGRASAGCSAESGDRSEDEDEDQEGGTSGGEEAEQSPPPAADRRPPSNAPEDKAETEAEVRLVHWAVSVRRGQPRRAGALRNTYLVVRAPWLQQAITSLTCWAQEQPLYHYTLRSAAPVTPELLARLATSLLVVEVWRRAAAAADSADSADVLVGLCRLPLDTLQAALTEPRGSDALTKLTSPVMAYEGAVSVVHPASGETAGRLQVSVAAGSQLQVDRWMLYASPPLSMQPEPPPDPDPDRAGCACVLTLRLGRLLHVAEVNEARAGQLDCLVRYNWPTQPAGGGQLRLECISTEPAASRVNPVLPHSSTYRYRAPDVASLARAFVAACRADGGVSCWAIVRSFYPVVTDTVVARGVVPSSDLLELIESCGGDGGQSRTFALPLTPLQLGRDPARPVLELTVTVDTEPESGQPTNHRPPPADLTAATASGSEAASGPFRARLSGPLRGSALRSSGAGAIAERREAWVSSSSAEELLVAVPAAGARQVTEPQPNSGEEASRTTADSQAAVVRDGTSEGSGPGDAEDQQSGGAEEQQTGDAEEQQSGDAEEPQSGDGEQPQNGDLEVDMLRRLRRPLGDIQRRRPAADADLLSCIERDLQNLRQTGSIFGRRESAERQAASPPAQSASAEASGDSELPTHTKRCPALAQTQEATQTKTLTDCQRHRSAEQSVPTAAADCRVNEQQTSPTPSAEPAPAEPAPAFPGQQISAADMPSLSVQAKAGDPLKKQAWSVQNGTGPFRVPDDFEKSGTFPVQTSQASHVQKPGLFRAQVSETSCAPISAQLPERTSGQLSAHISGPFLAETSGSSGARRAGPCTDESTGPFCAQSSVADGTFRAQLTVVQALHLPRIVLGGRREPPRPFVSVQTAEGCVCSGIQPGTGPQWNWSRTLVLDRELLLQGMHYLAVDVWHRWEAAARRPDRLLGTALLDLGPLGHGLDELLGWYNILDPAGVCRGQIKMTLRPLDPLPCPDPDSVGDVCDLSFSADQWCDPGDPGLILGPRPGDPDLILGPRPCDPGVTLGPRARATDLSLESPPPAALPPGGDPGNLSLSAAHTDGSGVWAPGSPYQRADSAAEEPECQLTEGSRSFLASVLRRNLDDLESLKVAMMRRIESGSVAQGPQPDAGGDAWDSTSARRPDADGREPRASGSQAAASLGAGGGHGELPGSVVALIETAVRRGAESDSSIASLLFADSLCSGSASESQSECGELLVSLLQELEPSCAGALPAILARDISLAVSAANGGAQSISSGPSYTTARSYTTTQQEPDSDRQEPAAPSSVAAPAPSVAAAAASMAAAAPSVAAAAPSVAAAASSVNTAVERGRDGGVSARRSRLAASLGLRR